MKLLYLLIVFSFIPFCVHTQNLRVITYLPEIVQESSGIDESSDYNFWTLNDGGGEPELYLCDTLGNLLKTVLIEGSWNRDWEDLAEDDKGNYYIGNIGNNSNGNRDLTIFKLQNPDSIDSNSIQAEVISFAYEDQNSFPPPQDSLNFDCEALMWHDGYLYLATKNRTVPFDGKTHLYQLPDIPGSHIATKIGSFDTQGNDMFTYWITSGDISPDGSRLCLLSSDKMWIFYDYDGNDFFDGKNIQINFNHLSQKEAVCFINNDELFISDEELIAGIGRQLFYIDISTFFAPTQLDEKEKVSLVVYPNPFENKIFIKGNKNRILVEILDIEGKKYYSQILNEYLIEINSTLLPLGELFVHIYDQTTGINSVYKIIHVRK
jgi:hypothetical protein